MNNKVVVSMYKCSKVIQHHVEISMEDAVKMLYVTGIGFELGSHTHSCEVSKCYNKALTYMNSIESKDRDIIIDKYFISADMSFEEVIEKFEITDYKVYNNEEYFSKFNQESNRKYYERYPVGSELKYRYNECNSDWEVSI